MQARNTLAILTYFAVTTSPLAQTPPEFLTLQAAISAGAEETYPLVRCAGFHLASTEWTGEATLGSELFQTFLNHVQMLTFNAALVRVEKHKTSLEQEVETAMDEVREIADLYRQRFQSNYASTGQAWGGDALWLSDRDLCTELFSR